MYKRIIKGGESRSFDRFESNSVQRQTSIYRVGNMNTFGKDTDRKEHEKDASIVGPNQCERDKPDQRPTVGKKLLTDTCKYTQLSLELIDHLSAVSELLPSIWPSISPDSSQRLTFVQVDAMDIWCWVGQIIDRRSQNRW